MLGAGLAREAGHLLAFPEGWRLLAPSGPQGPPAFLSRLLEDSGLVHS